MNRPAPKKLDQVVIRFAGDSGDGMQLLGGQFTRTSALAGNDVATLPDFPAEIRAPAGTREGVSGFQLHFAGYDIFTCLLYTSPSPRDKRQSRMPSSA